MTIDQAIALVKTTATQMNKLYGKTVFDEWAVVASMPEKIVLLGYIGPRKEGFQKSFLDDTKELRAQFRANQYNIGDFEFARHGHGTKAEAFLMIGDDIYLVCNNTNLSMTEIAGDSLWLSAQGPFMEMSERFRSEPLVHPM
jgi:hypothetical protein